jgi:hypothetical protein
MIRDHIIAHIGCTYTAERHPTDIWGDRVPGASEFFPNQEETFTIIAPTEAIARAWAEKKMSFRKDGKILNLVTERPDAAIIELTW